MHFISSPGQDIAHFYTLNWWTTALYRPSTSFGSGFTMKLVGLFFFYTSANADVQPTSITHAFYRHIPIFVSVYVWAAQYYVTLVGRRIYIYIHIHSSKMDRKDVGFDSREKVGERWCIRPHATHSCALHDALLGLMLLWLRRTGVCTEINGMRVLSLFDW